MKILSHASINGVLIFLGHKIEEDSTEATRLRLQDPMPKLTYNKMCPVQLMKQEEKRKKNSAKAQHIKAFRQCGTALPQAALWPAAANERAPKWIRKGNPLVLEMGSPTIQTADPFRRRPSRST